MDLRKKMLGKIGITLFSLSTLVGCPEENKVDKLEKTPQPKSYFAEIPMYGQSGMAMTSGDFNKDGDLDLIVGAQTISRGSYARLYYFENDGRGNLKLKTADNPITAQ